MKIQVIWISVIVLVQSGIMRLSVVSGDGSSWSQGGVLIHSLKLPPPLLLRLLLIFSPLIAVVVVIMIVNVTCIVVVHCIKVKAVFRLYVSSSVDIWLKSKCRP